MRPMTTTTDAPLPGLLGALESVGPRPVLVSHTAEGRVELSGHVLANWIIKTTNHLQDEVDLRPGESVVLALTPHWKRLVLAIGAWALGAEVTLLDQVVVADAEQDGDTTPGAGTAVVTDAATGAVIPGALGALPDVRVLVAEDPDSLPGDLAQRADELLLLHPRSLSLRFEGRLPPLAHDWITEVRAHADRLEAALGPWTGPPLGGRAVTSAAPEPGRDQDTTATETVADVADAPGDGLGQAATTMLATLRAGGRVVLHSDPLSETQMEAEGL